MNDVDASGGGGPRQASPAVLLTLVLAVALLAGAVSGAAVALLNESDSGPSPGPQAVASPAPTPPSSRATGFFDDQVAEVAVRSLPSVVGIVNQFEGQDVVEAGHAGGAGVVIDERGFILTAAHLVQIPGELFVLMNNGDVRPARLVAHDAPFTDIAVVQVEGGGLPAAPIGDSNLLVPGQTLIAIGSPDIDYFNTVTTGVVSAVGRRKYLQGIWNEDLIQTDTAINVGNSGGPLFTLRGEVVGINTFRDTGGGEDTLFGISFAVSSRRFAPIVQAMINTGSFPRPYLGVESLDLSPEAARELNLSQEQGALIQSVTPGSPAERAGLQEGDIVTMFGDVPISAGFGLLNALGVTAPDANIRVQLLREGAPLSLDVQLEPR